MPERGSEYQQPIFDAENSRTTPHNPPEILVGPNLSNEEMRNTPATTQGCSPEFCPQMGGLSDVSVTYPDMETDVETNPEHPNNSPTNHRSSRYN